jgi:fluoroacetyl-CoA thioesterase
VGEESAMDRLSPGLFGQKEMVVEEQHLASVWGNLGVEVLSTHFVVLLMEVASRDAVERLLEKGQMVVGTWISVRHMGAVPKGVIVRAESYLKEISGRKLKFDVSVYDPKEKIAEGRNELLVVSAHKFLERVQRKF